MEFKIIGYSTKVIDISTINKDNSTSMPPIYEILDNIISGNEFEEYFKDMSPIVECWFGKFILKDGIILANDPEFFIGTFICKSE